MNIKISTLCAAVFALGFAHSASAETICTEVGCFEQVYGPKEILEPRVRCVSPAYMAVRDGRKTCVRRDAAAPQVQVFFYCKGYRYFGLVGDLKKCVNYK